MNLVFFKLHYNILKSIKTCFVLNSQRFNYCKIYIIKSSICTNLQLYIIQRKMIITTNVFHLIDNYKFGGCHHKTKSKSFRLLSNLFKRLFSNYMESQTPTKLYLLKKCWLKSYKWKSRNLGAVARPLEPTFFYTCYQNH